MKNKLLAPRTGLVAAFAMTAALVTATPAGAATAGAATTGATASAGVVTVSQQAAATTTAAARPRNGAILFDRISGGRGVLKIKNGLRTDGVVILVRGKTKAISIYVRAKSTASIKDVRDGTYRLYFTTGYAYSKSRHRFTRSASYQRFNDRLRYTTTATSSRIYTLTLHPVRGGNAGTRHVNPKDFPA
ncbi:hypothetical protein Nocox_23825 [Nonomuraea coxensis DSM 45129]|uniref:Uncharacterized protein n=1 Tax=Nonomuraea coxensis DSM 45129 TaxID=1122611 RepID=A0ABX8U447_9ACTN|nr:hypothetical protein [Nonomuraea coxensis]QYC42368.1 hypothetical protein Nocox_23825 [Nonomuraea coxensis DSM 45129]